MASLNKVLLIGNLTRDPDLKYTPSGMALCKFGLAVNYKYKKDDEWKTDVTFVDITAWGKLEENASKHLSKGRLSCIEGRLSYSQWETDDGQKRSKLEVAAERIVFLGGGKGGKHEAPAENDDVPY